jgi:hypothetical protein
VQDYTVHTHGILVLQVLVEKAKNLALLDLHLLLCFPLILEISPDLRVQGEGELVPFHVLVDVKHVLSMLSSQNVMLSYDLSNVLNCRSEDTSRYEHAKGDVNLFRSCLG